LISSSMARRRRSPKHALSMYLPESNTAGFVSGRSTDRYFRSPC